jgi:mucin-19
MRIINLFVMAACLLLAGCGEFEWLPDNVALKQPSLTKAFDKPTTTIGSPATLTFTITNNAGNPAQSGLGFTDTFPAGTVNTPLGLVIANPPNANTTCGGTISAGGTSTAIAAGDKALTFSGGSIGTGPATCKVTVDVTSNASTSNLNLSFVNGAANISSLAGKLNNTVTDQRLAFSPITQAVINGTLSARDLVVNPNGNPQFLLFIDNTGKGANVTVTLTGKNASGTTVSTTKVPTDPVFVPSLAVGQQLTLSGVTVDQAIVSWQITGINATQ